MRYESGKRGAETGVTLEISQPSRLMIRRDNSTKNIYQHEQKPT